MKYINIRYIFSKHLLIHIFLQIADFIFLFMTYSFTSENENLVYKTFKTLLQFYVGIRESFVSEVISLDEIDLRKQIRLVTPE